MRALIEHLAVELQDFTERWLGVRVGTATGPLAAGAAPAIVLGEDSYGDLYIGSSDSERLSLVLPRDDDGSSLTVHFELVEHRESGQCDRWEVIIDGARDDEGAALLKIFGPERYRGHWSQNAVVRIVVNGTAAGG